MKNNNQKIIRQLSNRSLKNNRMRNIFAIIAISLTALLFTALFSLGQGMIQITEEQTMRQVGTWTHAGLKDVTMEQYEKITSHSLVKDNGYDIIIAIADNKELIKRQTEIRYTEPKNLDFCFIELKEGKLPQNEDEIVVDTIVMDMLGVPHEIGAKINLKFNFMGKDYDEIFIVSGWYVGDPVIGASQVYLSREFLDIISAGYTEEDFVAASKQNALGAGLIQGNILFSNSNNIEGKVIQCIEESGYTTDEIDYGINWGYLAENTQDMDLTSIIMIITAFLVMLLTGYLIIYNIFQISIINDIRFYGLLKTIGATRKQIQRLVRRQALLLSCVGIPIGLVLGYFAGSWMMPYFLGMSDGLNSSNFHLKANPYIFLFGALFSIFTVIISCRKPQKIAGKVSPVEAVKYADTKGTKKKTKKSIHGARLSKMALANMSRNKKKTLIVILSMSLSVILLTEVVTFTKSFKLDRYLDSMLTGDFTIAPVSLMNYTGLSDLLLSEDFYNAALSQEGIQNSGRLYHSKGTVNHTLSESGLQRYKGFYEQGLLRIEDDIRYIGASEESVQNVINNNTPIQEQRYAYDEILLDKLKIVEGSLDIEKYKTGKYVIVSPGTDTEETYYSPGDIIELSFHTDKSDYVEVKNDAGIVIDYQWINDSKRTYEVMAVVEIPYSMTERSFPINALVTILPTEELLKYDKDSECFAASFTVEDEKELTFQSFLENYTTQIDPNTDFESKESLRDEFSKLTNTFTLIGGALSLVIAIIGILNFVNTMLTSVITRKREFAMLQSIGLTNNQLKKMLLYEGMYYVAFTAVISFVIGSMLSVSVIKAFNNIANFFEYEFTVVPFISVIPVFAMIAFVVPLIAYRKAKKLSIVERLREE